MHDFIAYLVELLRRSIVFAVPLALVCAAGLGLALRGFRRRGKRFPWGKAVALVLLALWAAVTFYATLLRSEPTVRQWNLTPLLAWREAYQRFTLQIWLNVLLNVALFVPLGLLLPLLHRAFRRWYAATGAGLALSLGIELAQLFTMRGMFDVDDLINNALGALLGWSVTELALRLRARRGTWQRCCIPPLAFALALGCIFGGYALQPYGNLREASVERADLSGISWQVDCTLSTERTRAWVYQAEPYSSASAEAFAAAFAQRLGIVFPDAYYYDDLVIFANHSTGDFLHVTLHDGTWDHTVGDAFAPTFLCAADEVSEDALRDALRRWPLTLPEDAVFAREVLESGTVYVCFTADLAPVEDGTLSHGTLTCVLQEQDGGSTLARVENGIAALSPVREEQLCSCAEALALLRDGGSFDGAALAHSGAETITVLDCALDYLSDSKGFYQPVWRFTLMLDGAAESVTDYVPAL